MEDQSSLNQSPAPAQPVSTTQQAAPATVQTAPHQHRPIHWKYQLQQYGMALAVAVPFYVLFSLYLFYRRGYYDLYIANKIFAGVSAVLLGIVLLIGPLTRSFPQYHKYIQYRKELGITAYFLALAHGIVSYFFLTDHFPRERFYTYGLWPFIFGLAATIIVTVIFLISNQRSMLRLGTKVWWFMQSWGVRTAFVLIALHVGVMKYKSWIQWYQEGGAATLAHPEWPGLGLLIGWFVGFIVLVRLADMVSDELRKASLYALGVGLPAIIVFTFLWGLQF